MSKPYKSRHCFVPHCKSQYGSRSHEKVSLFNVPRDSARREQWARAIARTDREITVTDAVCEKHFRPADVIREWVDSAGIVCVPLKMPRLLKTAVPSIFPERPAVINRRERKTGKDGRREIVRIPYDPVAQRRRRIVARLKASKEKEETITDETPLTVKKVTKTYSAIAGVLNKGGEPRNEVNFDKIWKNVEDLNIPSPSWAAHLVENHRKQLLICECTIVEGKPLLLRQIVVEANLRVTLFIQEKEIDLKLFEECGISTVIHDISDLNKLIDFFAKVNICFGELQQF